MKKTITVDGNEACAYTSYMFTEVAGIYPITPSSPMAEHLDEWSNNNQKNLWNDNVKVVEMQSEAGASGMIHGSLQAGCLTSTYTASQGLLLMLPNLYKIAGEMLPGVIHVAARSLSTHALSIMGDHQDIYAARTTGVTMLASSSVQDATYLAAVAHLSAIKQSLPVMHFFDGFRTSHELQKINVLEKEDYLPMIDQEALQKFRNKALNVGKNITRGTAQNDDIYFQATEVRNKFYDEMPDIVNYYMEQINGKAGTNYQPFNYYGDECATKVIVAMGSVCETIKETIDALTKEGQKLGLIEVHLYRPFSVKYLKQVLPTTTQTIAVLDRTKEPGSIGEPLYLDIVSALQETNIKIVGGRYGLSSKNTTPADIKSVYDMLETPKHNFTIGIQDDVTNLSLETDKNFTTSTSKEILIYGYGSDGMVSASKSIIKLVGNNKDEYVQGYFQYDSKKSGGVTACHLRFSNKPIRSTYYVEHPEIVVVTKESYLKEFDCLSNIKENGTFILNTTSSVQNVDNLLTNQDQKTIIEKNIKVYKINAYELARKVGLKNKISTIMQSIIVKLGDLLDYELAKNEMKKYAKNRYFKKGEEVLASNYNAIDEALNYLEEIKVTMKETVTEKENTPQSVFELMSHRKGNELPTSAFLNAPDGTFEGGSSVLEKRSISDIVPHWIKENCIQCNQCAFVCPHAVIRPYLLTQEEYDKCPTKIQERMLKPLEKDLQDYYFTIGISIKDCTGCGVCINTCPGKRGEKALIPNNYTQEKKQEEQEIFNYLEDYVKEKNIMNDNTIKGSQFRKPKFMFHGACAGCGETAYIKLLTQLFGNELIIANATGCSSIYGASTPSMPYQIPWASSLFEDNAEYGYGMLIAGNTLRDRLEQLMNKYMDQERELFQKWIDNKNDHQITKEIYEQLKDKPLPKEIEELKEYIPSRMIWTIGGDGWAYDIGFSGIDHVLSSNDNVNILVLDSQVYSNTGGQSSKSSPKGSIASFTSKGKANTKKDLARIAMSYPNAYVAQVSLGANMMQVIKAFKEAAEHQGPSIVIAYTPCISHGIKGGMENSVTSEINATKCGYFPTFRYNPETEIFTLDSKNVNFDLYEEFLNSQTRYSMLHKINPEQAEQLLQENKQNAIKRYEYYQSLQKEKA